MRYTFFLFLSFFITSIAVGQEIKITNDLEAWAGIGFKKKLHKRYKLTVDQETRFNKSMSAFKSSLCEVKLIRDCAKNLELGISGRYKYFNKGENIHQNRFRYGLFANQQLFKRGLLKAEATVKYQQEFLTSMQDYNFFWKYRLKLTANLKNDYKPYFSSELFRIREVCRTPYFETLRMWLGTKKKLKNNTFSLALGYDYELNSEYPKSTWIMRLNYMFSSK